ncbi:MULTISPECIES: hypothetical protein [Mycolicibacterium]|uniref:TRAP transporter solute receptor, TAXI family n=1 Tax=Mycolicibacterium senegalense TaxID=1796 RepID=A0A378SXW2_9MYCO|nr:MULTISPECIES: hypothetical protein [Mycolicibacterium]MCV7337834.1 hypothetical protein [Mycolicibacterium senegalense]MDR7289275.1 hypothetical protein [Mycolicibacterium senegalense]QZA26137.1 hypothetical protein K3U95_08825 [Mycolicibacterium senegalense]CDP88727.1 hypothetical protein BN975_04570 [Mycolicibacterium farcinogenes]STZ53451.1 TRAP transporter solute receptor, TAXI family [Mycolicibacterium senegalense]
MSELAVYPYTVRFAPSGSYVPPGTRIIGVPDRLLCRNDIASDLVAAVVDVVAADAPYLFIPAPWMPTARCTAERRTSGLPMPASAPYRTLWR